MVAELEFQETKAASRFDLPSFLTKPNGYQNGTPNRLESGAVHP